jgi:glycosyltransferase involved in cell wall biosynthesis
VADIIYLGIRHWNTIKQRPQHLAEGLARSHRVLYVNPVGLSRFGKTYRTVADTPRLVGSGRLERIGQGLHLYSTPLAWLPLNYHFGVVNWLNHYVTSLRLRPILRALGWQNDLLWTSAPNHVAMIGQLPSERVCYDCMDFYALFWSNPLRRRLMEAQERRLIELADFVLVSSQSLQEHMLDSGKDAPAVHLVRNGAQAEHFSQTVSAQEVPDELQSIPGVVAGYVGTVSHWFDMALIQKLLDAYPRLSVVCIGPAEVDLEPYRQIDRLHFLGSRSYDDLPRYMARFEVLLIPFIINELVQAVNPVKVYEYLATGKPVVATAMRELQPLGRVCYLASEHDTFVAEVGTALDERHDPARQELLRGERRQAAAENTWESRIAQINRIFERNAQEPA